MNLYKIVVIVFLAILVGGCAAPASRDAMDISSTERSAYKTDKFLTGRVSVGGVIGGQDTNPAWTSEIGNEDFEAALRSSLETAYLLGGRASSEFILDAELIEIDQPMFGFTFTVTSKIRYTLRDAQSRETVLDEVILAEGTASTGDAFMGVKRLKIATERSAQENIQKIIDQLYQFDG